MVQPLRMKLQTISTNKAMSNPKASFKMGIVLLSLAMAAVLP